jgi:hypothetical protein
VYGGGASWVCAGGCAGAVSLCTSSFCVSICTFCTSKVSKACMAAARRGCAPEGVRARCLVQLVGVSDCTCVLVKQVKWVCAGGCAGAVSLCTSSFCVSICTFCTSKVSKACMAAVRRGCAPEDGRAECLGQLVGVSICTFVLVKQVNWWCVVGVRRRARGQRFLAHLQLLRQYLYFCTSKASKLSTWRRRLSLQRALCNCCVSCA